MKKKVLSLTVATMLLLSLAGCTEADKVTANMSHEADFFGTERRITVYNAMSDKVLLEVEGYMSIKNEATDELSVICKVGPNEYKKNYIFLGNFTLYVVEDINGTHPDPYHYRIDFHTGPQIAVDVRP